MVGRHLGWLRRPQLFVGFVALCLLLVTYGDIVRGRAPADIPSHIASVPSVMGASTRGRPALPPVDCTIRPCIALTFDDGPDRRITPQILDILRANNVHATFFLVGREVPDKQGLVQRIFAEGHEIGNHTWDHKDLTTLSDRDIAGQIDRTQAAIAAAGVPAPVVFRPPYGSVDNRVRAHVPLPLIRWDVDTEDWYVRDAAKVTDHLLHDVHPGAVVLMHDKYDATAAALSASIQTLGQTYQFVTISQLLALSPGDQGQYFNR